MPLVHEELFWGDAGIGMSLKGTGAGVVGDLLERYAGAVESVDASVLRHAG